MGGGTCVEKLDYEYYSHSVCHQYVIVFLVYLNVMIETLSASYHCPRTTYLTGEGKQYSYSKYLRAISIGEECYPDAKLDA
jgi:hypothetical protein